MKSSRLVPGRRGLTFLGVTGELLHSLLPCSVEGSNLNTTFRTLQAETCCMLMTLSTLAAGLWPSSGPSGIPAKDHEGAFPLPPPAASFPWPAELCEL